MTTFRQRENYVGNFRKAGLGLRLLCAGLATPNLGGISPWFPTMELTCVSVRIRTAIEPA